MIAAIRPPVREDGDAGERVAEAERHQVDGERRVDEGVEDRPPLHESGRLAHEHRALDGSVCCSHPLSFQPLVSTKFFTFLPSSSISAPIRSPCSYELPGLMQRVLPMRACAAGLVDVPVQREHWAGLLDRLPHRRRAHRLRGVAAVLRLQVLVDAGGVVEARPVRRAVQVQDRPLGRGGELRRHRPDPLEQDVLGLLAVGVPRGRVRPPRRRHLEAVDVDHAALGQLDPAGGGQDRVDLELVVVPGADEHGLRLAGELVVGHLHPPLDGAEHVAVEELVEPLGVGLELRQLVGRRAERVVPAPDHVLLERGHLGHRPRARGAAPEASRASARCRRG